MPFCHLLSKNLAVSSRQILNFNLSFLCCIALTELNQFTIINYMSFFFRKMRLSLMPWVVMFMTDNLWLFVVVQMPGATLLEIQIWPLTTCSQLSRCVSKIIFYGFDLGYLFEKLYQVLKSHMTCYNSNLNSFFTNLVNL